MPSPSKQKKVGLTTSAPPGWSPSLGRWLRCFPTAWPTMSPEMPALPWQAGEHQHTAPVSLHGSSCGAGHAGWCLLLLSHSQWRQPGTSAVPILVGPTDLCLLHSQLPSCRALLQVINHHHKTFLLLFRKPDILPTFGLLPLRPFLLHERASSYGSVESL